MVSSYLYSPTFTILLQFDYLLRYNKTQFKEKRNSMLVADISDQLGNQMFAYAAVKTIAQKKSMSSVLSAPTIRGSTAAIPNTGPSYTPSFRRPRPNCWMSFLRFRMRGASPLRRLLLKYTRKRRPRFLTTLI